MFKITFLSTFGRILSGMIFFFMPLILIEKGVGAIETGILLSIFSFTPILLSLPSGILNDRLQAKYLLAFSLLGCGIFYVGLAQLNTFVPLLPFFCIGGICMNLGNISIQSLALKVVGTEDKSKKLGLYSGISMLGYSFGIILGGIIMLKQSPDFLLQSAAVIYMVLAFISLRIQDTDVVKLNLLEYLSALKEKNVLYFCLTYAFFALHWGAETSSYSLFLKEFFHLGKFQSALYMGIPIFFLGLATILVGKWLDAKKELWDKFTILAFILSGFGQVMMVVPSVEISLIMRIIHETGDGIAGILLLAGMAHRFKVDRIGGLSSLVTLINILAQTVGIMMFTYIGDIWGHNYSMCIGGLTALLPIVFYLSTRK